MKAPTFHEFSKYFPNIPQFVACPLQQDCVVVGFCVCVSVCVFCDSTGSIPSCSVLQNISTHKKRLCLGGWVGGGGSVFSDYFCLTRCSKIDIFLPVLHERSRSFAFLSQVLWVNTSQRLKFSFRSLCTWPKAPRWSWNASLWGSKFTPTKYVPFTSSWQLYLTTNETFFL